jgi:hypothetical protein
MDQNNLRLTVTERMLLERSSDLALTRRRLRLVVISGLLLAGALVVTAPLFDSWEFLLFFAVAYILVTTWERVGYARTILAYKGLVLKLAALAEAQENRGDEVPPVS